MQRRGKERLADIATKAAAIGPFVLALAIAGVLIGHGDEVIAAILVAAAGALTLLSWYLGRDQRRALELANDARRAAEAATARMALLADVGRAAAGGVSVRDVTHGLVDLLVPRIADLCAIEVADPQGVWRRAALRWAGPGGDDVERRLLERPLAADKAETLTPALQEGEAVLMATVDADALAAAAYDKHDRALLASLGLRSTIAVSLSAGGRVVGALRLAVGPSGRSYRDEDLELLRLVAGRAALAIANARLVDEVSATREQLDKTLATLAEAVTVTDRDRRIRYANQAAASLLGYATPDELMAEEPGAIAARWISAHEDGRPLRPEDFPSWRVVNGLPADPLLTHIVHRETGEERWRLVKAAPLRSPAGELLAVNIIEDVTEAKQAELRERFLAQAGEALAASLSPEETLQRVVELAVPTLADWCAVDILDARGVAESVAVAHTDPGKVDLARELRNRYPPRRDAERGLYAVVRSGRPGLYPEVDEELLRASAESPEHLAAIQELGVRSAMIIPMRVAGRTIGALTCVSSESGRSFNEDDLAFAGELARRAATAVENARLYTERAQTARTLQESLVPARLASVPGWRTAASYQPGDDAAQIGGDFYDLVALERGFIVVVGDVTGKGVEAAALTSLARYTLATAARFDPSPEAVVRLLNDVLVERSHPSLVTAACAHLEPRSDGVLMRVACAGHPPPLLAREGRDALPIANSGLLLGAAAGTEWAASEVQLQPGDTVLFYTDGVIDTPGENGRFGDERLREVVADGAVDPEVLIARIERAVLEFQHGDVVDDRAVLALQLVSLAAALGEELTAAPVRSVAAPPPGPP